MSGNQQSNSGGTGGGDGRIPRDMKDLLKICAEMSSNTEGQTQNEAHSFQNMSAERKEWLEAALTDMTTDPVARMRDCIKQIKDSNNTDDDDAVVAALEELVEWTEQIDFAIDFHKIGGFEIFHSCTHYERSPEVRSLVLELVATLVQNNPYCQAAVIESGFFPEMLKILDNDEEAAVKIKALYAVSCLTRDNEAAQKLFTENDGFSVLMRAMQTNIEKLKIKAAFLSSSFVVDKPQYKDILCDIGMIDQLVGHLCEEHSGFHEHLMSALLAIVSEHPRSVSECLRPELRTIELLKERQKELKGKDAYREELEYTTKLLEILTSSDGQDVVR